MTARPRFVPLLRAVLPAMLAAAPGWASSTSARNSVSERPAWSLELRDQAGVGFDLRDMIGQTLLLNFIFTSCPSACPMQTAELKEVQSRLSQVDKLASRFVSVSIDPETDTPERLRAFAAAAGIDGAHWRFAVPDDARALTALTQRLAAKVGKDASGNLEHKLVVYLIDARGRVVQHYSGTRLDKQRIARDISTLNRLARNGSGARQGITK